MERARVGQYFLAAWAVILRSAAFLLLATLSRSPHNLIRQHPKRVNRITLYLFLVFTAIPAFSSPSPEREWTYLFYVAGDEAEIDAYSRLPIRKLDKVR